jgi:uncharacterized protein (DUF697 family)
MSNLSIFSGPGAMWNTLKEVDLRPLEEEALRMPRLAIVGQPDGGRDELADCLRRDPSRLEQRTDTPLLILNPQACESADSTDLILLLLDARPGQGPDDFAVEKELARKWSSAGQRVLVVIRRQLDQPKEEPFGVWTGYARRRVVQGALEDPSFLQGDLAAAAILLLPDKLLALGRHFPLFRVPIAHHLINDTTLTNTAYSVSTGLAEIIPVMDIPLNVTDMLVLTKNQAFLAYKLGLALGMSTRWQDYVAEFGGVLGSGFVWRQAARSLIGLIPVWGILPKAAIAYGGTYVVGNVILQWYLTGRRLTGQQMRQLYAQSTVQGRILAGELYRRMKSTRLSTFRLPKIGLPKLSAPRFSLPRLGSGSKPKAQVCPECGGKNSAEAHYCQLCGKPLATTGDADPKSE